MTRGEGKRGDEMEGRVGVALTWGSTSLLSASIMGCTTVRTSVHKHGVVHLALVQLHACTPPHTTPEGTTPTSNLQGASTH